MTTGQFTDDPRPRANLVNFTSLFAMTFYQALVRFERQSDKTEHGHQPLRYINLLRVRLSLIASATSVR